MEHDSIPRMLTECVGTYIWEYVPAYRLKTTLTRDCVTELWCGVFMAYDWTPSPAAGRTIEEALEDLTDIIELRRSVFERPVKPEDANDA